MGNAQGPLNSTQGDDSESESEEEDGYDETVDPAIFSSWQPINYGSSQSDRRGLLKVYKNAGGEGWRNRQGWNRGTPLGTWFGVSVEARFGQKMVTQISLHHNRLRGSLSKTAFGYPMMIHLEVLNLGHNRLRGPLPAELQLIEKLKELTLNDNLLTGPVPEFLANMPRLQKVDLSSNALSGDLNLNIPVSLARTSTMEIFDVNHNELTGYISEEWGLVDSLRELGLGGNKFTGAIPSELCGLAVLERLDLHENKLNSKIPSELGQLVALKRLRLHGNTHLEGSLPEEFLEVGRLDVLSMHFENATENRGSAFEKSYGPPANTL